MTYLTRLILNPRSKQVRNELADPYEMHRTVMKAFAGNLQEDERVLFRVDVPRTGIPTLLVQSKHEPDWAELTATRKKYLLDESYLPFGEENLALKKIDFNEKLRTEQRLAFRLWANPTVKKARFNEKGEHLNSNRVPLVREEEQMKWLEDKFALKNAASLISARITSGSDQHGKLFKEKDKKKRMKFHAVLFEGILEITDKDEFQKMLIVGIGPGKGLGFGLLSLAPSRG